MRHGRTSLSSRSSSLQQHFRSSCIKLKKLVNLRCGNHRMIIKSRTQIVKIDTTPRW